MNNKEIKFRSWDKILKCFIYFKVSNYRLEIIKNQNNILSKDKDREELQQFIGLRDKNKKDIYEGDIVKTDDCYQESFIVEYHEPEFCLSDNNGGVLCDLTWEEWEELEIIGNIYENKKNMEESIEKLENKTKDILKKISKKETEFILQINSSNIIKIEIDEIIDLHILQKLKEYLENRLKEIQK